MDGKDSNLSEKYKEMGGEILPIFMRQCIEPFPPSYTRRRPHVKG